MKQFFNIVVLLISVLVFGAIAGCTRVDSEVDAPCGSEMRFTATASTRAAATTTATITTMGVSAYHTGTDTWATAGATATPNWIYNREITRSGSAWSYSPAAYWPYDAAQRLSFFAYSPYASASNGIALSTESATGNPKLTFTVAELPANQIDLLAAAPETDLTNNNGAVAFSFAHATTAITFAAKAAAASAEYTLKVESITARFVPATGKVYRRGTIDLATSTWTVDNNPDAPAFTSDIVVAMPAVKPALTTIAQTVAAPEATMFMLPQAVAAGAVVVDVAVTKTYTSDSHTETLNFNDVALPATTWGKSENYAYVLTVSELGISPTITVWTGVSIGIEYYINFEGSPVRVSNLNSNNATITMHTNWTGQITTSQKVSGSNPAVQASWLSDIQVDRENSRVTFDVEAQGPTGRERRATVTLSTQGLSSSFEIIQAANGTYEIDVTTPYITYAGGNISFSLTSRFNPYNATPIAERWTAETVDVDGNPIACPSWLTGFVSSGAGSATPETLTVNIAAITPINVNLDEAIERASGTTVLGTAAARYDLSTKGGGAVRETANCYVVNRPGFYSFPCNVMGIGDHGIIAGAGFTDYLGNTLSTSAAIDMSAGTWRAQLLWQDEAGQILNVGLNGNNIVFETPSAADMRQCNALIALQVSTDSGQTWTTAWSWHIWITVWQNDSFNERVYASASAPSSPNQMYDIMPVSLGYKATGAMDYYASRSVFVRFSQPDNGYTKVILLTQHPCFDIPITGEGLHYQWGRKDPFPCGTVATSATATTIADAIQNPSTFIATSDDWLTAQNNALWGNPQNLVDNWTTKTIYDPSPRSYIVTLVNNYSNFVFGGSPNVSYSNDLFDGYHFYCRGSSGETTYFNAHGYRAGATETDEGVSGNYWTINYVDATTTAVALQFNDTTVTTDAEVPRANGLSLRPTIDPLYVTIGDKGEDNYGDIWN